MAANLAPIVPDTAETLSIVDRRTGQHYELPIENGADRKSVV